jgi:hypothetical protein
MFLFNHVKKAKNTNQSKHEKCGLFQIPKAKITYSHPPLTGSLNDPKPTKYSYALCYIIKRFLPIRIPHLQEVLTTPSQQNTLMHHAT